MTRTVRPWLVLMVLALLGGCSGGDENELNTWMVEQRNAVKPRVAAVSEPKSFAPQAYEVMDMLEPFNPQKLTRGFKSEAANPVANSALITPELNRRKEPLEVYPLDLMALVGGLERQGQRVALVQIDKLLYQVRVGAYLGQNYGKIVKISETELTLREIVQDAVGEWIERPAVLHLQEETKP